MAFEIIRNDITKVKADAIVNTANPFPTCGGGTDYAIYTAAGMKELLAARKKIGVISRGQAVETPAFHLPAKYIIHTVGPVWEGGSQGEFDILKSCYENSLQLAEKLGCQSVAFPLIATGTYGFPKDKALQIAMSVIQPFVMEHSMKVILVVFDKKAFELSGSVVENIREFVDANYVQEAKKKEYSIDRSVFINPKGLNLPLDQDRISRRPRESERTSEDALRQRGKKSAFKSAPVPLEKRDISFDCNPVEEEGISSIECKMQSSRPLPVWGQPQKADRSPDKRKVDIRKLVASQEKTFQEKLFEIIDERGLTGPQVYKNYISKQVYSKIQADRDYHPNKFTAIALCLSLHLNIEETRDLIGRAGWTLSPSNKADLVVTGCIMNEEYNLVRINILLFEFDCPVLEKIK